MTNDLNGAIATAVWSLGDRDAWVSDWTAYRQLPADQKLATPPGHDHCDEVAECALWLREAADPLPARVWHQAWDLDAVSMSLFEVYDVDTRDDDELEAIHAAQYIIGVFDDAGDWWQVLRHLARHVLAYAYDLDLDQV